jgi:hypothetical protein
LSFQDAAKPKAPDTIYANVIPPEAFDFLDIPTSSQQETKRSGLSDWFVNEFLSPPERIDILAKKLFPLLYILFNALYWLYYLVISD